MKTTFHDETQSTLYEKNSAPKSIYPPKVLEYITNQDSASLEKRLQNKHMKNFLGELGYPLKKGLVSNRPKRLFGMATKNMVKPTKLWNEQELLDFVQEVHSMDNNTFNRTINCLKDSPLKNAMIYKLIRPEHLKKWTEQELQTVQKGMSTPQVIKSITSLSQDQYNHLEQNGDLFIHISSLGKSKQMPEKKPKVSALPSSQQAKKRRAKQPLQRAKKESIAPTKKNKQVIAKKENGTISSILKQGIKTISQIMQPSTTEKKDKGRGK
ncbi:MAG: hypothetical protein P8P83_03770 [Rickettsiaceae bacterium]|nr:hypothetical protein [Rickettsiaceae bacterium]